MMINFRFRLLTLTLRDLSPKVRVFLCFTFWDFFFFFFNGRMIKFLKGEFSEAGKAPGTARYLKCRNLQVINLCNKGMDR